MPRIWFGLKPSAQANGAPMASSFSFGRTIFMRPVARATNARRPATTK
jgi:hypothetical protein